MAEWLRRQIRTRLIICFPLGAQVQILLVSSFLNTYFYIVVAVVVASECGTVGCTVGAGGGSSEAREPERLDIRRTLIKSTREMNCKRSFHNPCLHMDITAILHYNVLTL
jgi:hypothetical protein